MTFFRYSLCMLLAGEEMVSNQVTASKDAVLFPDELDTYVHLSQLFLSKGDIESCVIACDHLLRIMGLERDILLSSLDDLGAQFLLIGHRLSEEGKSGLSKICIDVGLSLGKPKTDQLIPLAEQLFADRDFQGGIACLERLAASDPGNPELITLINKYASVLNATAQDV